MGKDHILYSPESSFFLPFWGHNGNKREIEMKLWTKKESGDGNEHQNPKNKKKKKKKKQKENFQTK